MKIDKLLGKKVLIRDIGDGVVYAVKEHVHHGKTYLVQHLVPGSFVERWYDEDLITPVGVALDPRECVIELLEMCGIGRKQQSMMEQRISPREDNRSPSYAAALEMEKQVFSNLRNLLKRG